MATQDQVQCPAQSGIWKKHPIDQRRAVKLSTLVELMNQKKSSHAGMLVQQICKKMGSWVFRQTNQFAATVETVAN